MRTFDAAIVYLASIAADGLTPYRASDYGSMYARIIADARALRVSTDSQEGRYGCGIGSDGTGPYTAKMTAIAAHFAEGL